MNEEEYRLAVAQALTGMRQALDGLAERAVQHNARLDALGSLVYVLLQSNTDHPALATLLREQFEKAEANLLASAASDEFIKLRRQMFEMNLPASLRMAVFPPTR